MKSATDLEPESRALERAGLARLRVQAPVVWAVEIEHALTCEKIEKMFHQFHVQMILTTSSYGGKMDILRV